VVGASYLAAALGVAGRRPWGRALATVVSAVGLTLNGASLVAALTGAGLVPVPGLLVNLALDP
jgi:hypothetical protein